MNLKAVLVTLAAVASSVSHGYCGAFKPDALLRNSAEVTFIDTQLAGATCLAHTDSALDVLLAPLVLQSMACAFYEKRIVIAPISFGPGQLYALHALATPDALLGHETLHIFKGAYHPMLLPCADSVRSPADDSARGLPDQKHARNVPETGQHALERVGVRDRKRCVIFTHAEAVNYADFGALIRACLDER